MKELDERELIAYVLNELPEDAARELEQRAAAEGELQAQIALMRAFVSGARREAYYPVLPLPSQFDDSACVRRLRLAKTHGNRTDIFDILAEFLQACGGKAKQLIKHLDATITDAEIDAVLKQSLLTVCEAIDNYNPAQQRLEAWFLEIVYETTRELVDDTTLDHALYWKKVRERAEGNRWYL